ncbi:MAG: PAS domain-containing protein [Thermoplasmata archaeon]
MSGRPSGKAMAPEGHPVHTLMAEHDILLDLAEELGLTASAIGKTGRAEACGEELEHLQDIIEHFRESEKHYLREENGLFPVMERHGFSGPTVQMWTEHNEIREVKKRLYSLAEAAVRGDLKGAGGLEALSGELRAMLESHFTKENSVLFPMALSTLTGGEWAEVASSFDEIGYCCFTPAGARGPGGAVRGEKERGAGAGAEGAETAGERKVAGKGRGRNSGGGMAMEPEKELIELRTGRFSREELETVLNTLPVDITFVGVDDAVRYYSDGPHRIFPRTVAIIGRKVQNCHPQKSIHAVQRILDEFRAGRRDVAEFWINMGGRVIHIRYFAVRRDGRYLGTLEVSQDITEIQKIRGEKRLLD